MQWQEVFCIFNIQMTNLRSDEINSSSSNGSITFALRDMYPRQPADDLGKA